MSINLIDMKPGESRLIDGVKMVAIEFNEQKLSCKDCHYSVAKNAPKCPGEDETFCHCSGGRQKYMGSVLFMEENEYLKRRLAGTA